ncbi:GyrI-like domain-containing protein [Brevibacterium daeguense]|nr:GyrI-like domain-containing protein [Brevibacterium daeguense]
MSDPHAYLVAEARNQTEFFSASEVPTAVVKATDYPVSDLPALFDSAFSALFPALGERGVQPVGPAFALYQRMPDDTVDLEVGVPVEQPLAETIELEEGRSVEPSAIPGGRLAAVSHHGSYDALSEAWTDFMTDVSTSGSKPQLPFWEVYVTEPKPDMDPADLRTDLYVIVDSATNSDTDAG